jgi:hypothetical protein
VVARRAITGRGQLLTRSTTERYASAATGVNLAGLGTPAQPRRRTGPVPLRRGSRDTPGHARMPWSPRTKDGPGLWRTPCPGCSGLVSVAPLTPRTAHRQGSSRCPLAPPGTQALPLTASPAVQLVHTLWITLWVSCV